MNQKNSILLIKKYVLYSLFLIILLLTFSTCFTQKTKAMVVEASGIPPALWTHDEKPGDTTHNSSRCIGARTLYGGGADGNIYGASNAVWVSDVGNSAIQVIQVPSLLNDATFRLNGIVGWCRSNMLDGAGNPYPFHATPVPDPTSIPTGFNVYGRPWCSAWCEYKINERSLRKVIYTQITGTLTFTNSNNISYDRPLTFSNNTLTIDVARSYLNDDSYSLGGIDLSDGFSVSEDSFYVKGLDSQGNYNYGNAPSGINFSATNLSNLPPGTYNVKLSYSFKGVTEYYRVDRFSYECKNVTKDPATGLDRLFYPINLSAVELNNCATDTGALFFQVTKQNNPPSATMSATCSSNTVTVSTTNINDTEGANLTITYTYTSSTGLTTSGPTTITKLATGYPNQSLNFTGKSDGQLYNVTAVLSDGSQSVNLSANYRCPVAVSCEVNPITVEVGSSFAPRVKIRSSTTLNGNVTVDLFPSLEALTPVYTVTKIFSIVAPSTETEVLFDSISAPSAGDYFLRGSFRYTSGGINRTTVCSNTLSPTNTLRVVNRPAFKIYNGDVSVGSNFQNTDGTCAPKTNSNDIVVDSWADVSLTFSFGSSSQYAARIFAQSIDNFYTFSINQAVAPRGKALTLANTNNVWGNSIGSGNCIRNFFVTRDTLKSKSIKYWSDVSNTGDLNNDGLADQYYSDGNLTISGVKTFDNNVVLYVNGDVFIRSDILLSTNYTYSPDGKLKVPFFGIVAKGNINIDSPVKQLDGVYIAQPLDDNTQGIIRTCSNGFTTHSLNNLYNNCGGIASLSGLQFNGYVAAKKIELMRTKSSYSNVKVRNDENITSNPLQIAESFTGLPELNIADNPLNTFIQETNQFDSISNLPPLL